MRKMSAINLMPETYLIFSFGTIVWIVSGGIGQVARVIYLYLQTDKLNFLSKNYHGIDELQRVSHDLEPLKNFESKFIPYI